MDNNYQRRNGKHTQLKDLKEDLYIFNIYILKLNVIIIFVFYLYIFIYLTIIIIYYMELIRPDDSRRLTFDNERLA